MRAPSQTTVCCSMFAEQLTAGCPADGLARHASPFTCPDVLVIHVPRQGYGLIIHDGGESIVTISYCPWCGAALDSLNG